MKKMLFAVLALACTGSAFAQSQSTSDASAGSSSGAQAGVELNTYAPDHIRETLHAPVPLTVVGYGAGSQNNCMVSVGGGASVPAFALIYNGPKADTNCQAIVLGDGFGRDSVQALNTGQPELARKLLNMAIWSKCTANPRAQKACMDLGLVVPTTLDSNKAQVSAAQISYEPPKKIIPHRPAGWTGVAGSGN